MRNDDLKGRYSRLSKIPDEGYLEKDPDKLLEKIVKDHLLASKDALPRYQKKPLYLSQRYLTS